MAIKPLPTADGEGPDPRSIGTPLDRLLRSMGSPSSRTVAGIGDRWEEVAGPQLAAHTRPLRVRAGVLVVLVDDPAWASEVRWMGDTLATRAREILNDGSIERIEVRVDPGASGPSPRTGPG